MYGVAESIVMTPYNNCVNSDHFKLGLAVHFAALHCCTAKPSLKGQVTQDVMRLEVNRSSDKMFQWIIAIAMFLVFFFISMISGVLVSFSFFWIWLIFLLLPLSYIFSAPLFKLTGYFIYLSPMLVVSKPSDKTYKLHEGTLLDFFIMMKRFGRINLKRRILYCYLSGILKIVEKIENKSLSEGVIITTSTYLLSNRTISRLGFNVSKTGIGDKFSFIAYYPSLLLVRSLVYGRISFPQLKNIKTLQVSGEDLVKNKYIISAIYSRVKLNN